MGPVHGIVPDNIHIHIGGLDIDPGKAAKDVAGVGKDQVEQIVKDVLPDEIKNLPQHVMHEAVNKVVIPVISDVLKPLEKLVFSAGVKVLETAHREVVKAAGGPFVDDALVEQAKEWAATVPDNDDKWAQWLTAMGVTGYEEAGDAITLEQARKQAEVWDGWEPFVKALENGEHVDSGEGKEVIDAFNSIYFYVANAGNVSIGLYFTQMWDRAQTVIDTLKRYEHSGVPVKRSAIMDFVRAIQPDKVDITVSAKIEIGIEIGGSVGAWGVPASLFDLLVDEVLKEAGVPA